MFRTIYINTFIAISTFFFAILGLFTLIFVKKTKFTHFHIAMPWARNILRVSGVQLRLKGIDNIDPDQPYIFMANHQSRFDIFSLIAGLPVSFKFIMKRELLKIPLFGLILRKMRYIAIDRKNRAEAIKTINMAVTILRDGESILIFPEGTRSRDGQLLPFKKGGFHLAIKSECDIVPISISGSREILRKKGTMKGKRTIIMAIGRPVPASVYSEDNITGLIDSVREVIIRHRVDLNRTER